MKKYLLILLSIISFWSCGSEDETIDISILPAATSTGANTFGCLVDGWVYVGGRYRGWDYSDPWTHDSFIYYEKRQESTDPENPQESVNPQNPEENIDEFRVSVRVKPGIFVNFKIEKPQEGKNSRITSVSFDGKDLQPGTAFITRFDTQKKIISGTFGNGKRLTNGRFDVYYATNDNQGRW